MSKLFKSVAFFVLCLASISQLLSMNIQPSLSFNYGMAVSVLAYSRDGRFLAAGGYSGDIKIFDFDTKRICNELNAHNDPVVKISFHPSSGIMVSRTRHEINVYNFNDGQLEIARKHTYKGKVIDFSGNCEKFVVYENKEPCNLEIYDLLNNKNLGFLDFSTDKYRAFNRCIVEIGINENGNKIVLNRRGPKAKVLSLVNFSIPIVFVNIRDLEDENMLSGNAFSFGSRDFEDYFFHKGRCNYKQIFISSIKFQRYSYNSMKEISLCDYGVNRFYHFSSSHDSKKIAIICTDPNIILVLEVTCDDGKIGSKELYRFGGHANRCDLLTFDTSGRKLAARFRDETVNIYNVPDSCEFSQALLDDMMRTDVAREECCCCHSELDCIEKVVGGACCQEDKCPSFYFVCSKCVKSGCDLICEECGEMKHIVTAIS